MAPREPSTLHRARWAWWFDLLLSALLIPPVTAAFSTDEDPWAWRAVAIIGILLTTALLVRRRRAGIAVDPGGLTVRCPLRRDRRSAWREVWAFTLEPGPRGFTYIAVVLHDGQSWKTRGLMVAQPRGPYALRTVASLEAAHLAYLRSVQPTPSP